MMRRIYARLVEERVATGESWAIYEFECGWPPPQLMFYLDVTNGRLGRWG